MSVGEREARPDTAQVAQVAQVAQIAQLTSHSTVNSGIRPGRIHACGEATWHHRAEDSDAVLVDW